MRKRLKILPGRLLDKSVRRTDRVARQFEYCNVDAFEFHDVCLIRPSYNTRLASVAYQLLKTAHCLYETRKSCMIEQLNCEKSRCKYTD
jgi:hypothetical protein